MGIPFEVLEALRNLDEPVPAYLKYEMFFLPNDSNIRAEVIDIFTNLEGTGCGTGTLVALLRTVEP
jgi:hypothetical protein